MDGMAHLDHGHIEAVGRSVLEDFLKIPVIGTDAHSATEESCGALVGISGAWHGVVEIRLDEALSIQVAAAMFRCAADQVDDARLRDALDEVANIIGGNIKALLPAPSRLSMPEFRHAGSAVPEMDIQARLLSESGEALWIGVASLDSV
jgi:hypothetical protein